MRKKQAKCDSAGKPPKTGGKPTNTSCSDDFQEEVYTHDLKNGGHDEVRLKNACFFGFFAEKLISGVSS